MRKTWAFIWSTKQYYYRLSPGGWECNGNILLIKVICLFSLGKNRHGRDLRSDHQLDLPKCRMTYYTGSLPSRPLLIKWWPKVPLCTATTDIEKRSQNSYISPCNGVISHGAPIEGIPSFCQPHTQKQMQTKCVHDLRVPCSISRLFTFTLRPQYIRTWRITVILIAEKTWIPPIWAPCWDKDGTGSGTSGLYLWLPLKLIQFFTHVNKSNDVDVSSTCLCPPSVATS